MGKITGNELFGRAVAREGCDTGFFIMGGPSNDAINAAIAEGVRMIDVRHEQAAAMMANAYARVRARPAFCMTASGPGTINLTTGLAHALVDCAPLVAFGGASPVGQYARGAFQEIDQLAIMKPVTKFAERVYDTARIPEYVARAFRMAKSGKPGPVYLDLPGDVLYGEVDEDKVRWPAAPAISRPQAEPGAIEAVIELMQQAKRPLLLTGSGIIWSQASAALEAFVEATGIPFYTTPQGRGVIAEDHPFFYALARSKAFRDADLVIVAGSRLNYVYSYGEPPRFAADARFVRIDIDQAEIESSLHLTQGVIGDVGAVLAQLSAAAEGRIEPGRYADWRQALKDEDARKIDKHEASLATDQTPIHPLRLCKEVRDFISRDAILCVDGQEILNYGRQAIPSYRPGHRLNSGPFGTMGVGLPFGVGAKAAAPDRDVVVLHGDGSFGLNAMEIDTAVRHNLPLLIVISLNGGWTADPERKKPGRELGYTRFDRMAEAFGCHGEFVEKPEDIRPALERAAAEVAKGRVALVNVLTDWRARAGTAAFTSYST